MSLYNKILVPVDFSSHSGEALDHAVDLAKQFGAELHVAHVFSPPLPLVSPYEVAMTTELFEEARRSAADRLGKEVSRVSESGIQVVTHLLEAPPAPAIVELAERLEADLIVMGTRGNTGLKHVVLGSVAERTLRLAPCHVLAVKARASKG